MSRSDEREKRQQILKALAAKCLSQCISRALGLPGFHENQGSGRKHPVFGVAVRCRPIEWLLDCFEALINWIERSMPRWRCRQQLDHLVDGLQSGVRVARRMTVTDKKPAVANETVAYRAGAREKDEKALLEERGHRVVEVCPLAKSHSLSMTSGASGVETQKFGTSRKRFSASIRRVSRLKLSFISIPYTQWSTNCEEAPRELDRPLRVLTNMRDFEPPSRPTTCPGCKQPMRFAGRESHPVASYIDLLTFQCACGQVLTVPSSRGLPTASLRV